MCMFCDSFTDKTEQRADSKPPRRLPMGIDPSPFCSIPNSFNPLEKTFYLIFVSLGYHSSCYGHRDLLYPVSARDCLTIILASMSLVGVGEWVGAQTFQNVLDMGGT